MTHSDAPGVTPSQQQLLDVLRGGDVPRQVIRGWEGFAAIWQHDIITAAERAGYPADSIEVLESMPGVFSPQVADPVQAVRDVLRRLRFRAPQTRQRLFLIPASLLGGRRGETQVSKSNRGWVWKALALAVALVYGVISVAAGDAGYSWFIGAAFVGALNALPPARIARRERGQWSAIQIIWGLTFTASVAIGTLMLTGTFSGAASAGGYGWIALAIIVAYWAKPAFRRSPGIWDEAVACEGVSPPRAG